MNDEEKENWSKVREEGQGRYILVEGLLKAGFFFAVFMAIFYYLFDYGFTFAKLGEALTDGGYIFKFFFHWIFFGLWAGVFNWHQSEKSFKKPSSTK